jgi:hypothetical protein
MSVFSVEPKSDNPVTAETLKAVCNGLGVSLRDEEQEDYRKLLAVFDESAREIMAMDGAYTLRIHPLEPSPGANVTAQTTCLQLTRIDSHERTSTFPPARTTATELGHGVATSKDRTAVASWRERPWH